MARNPRQARDEREPSSEREGARIPSSPFMLVTATRSAHFTRCGIRFSQEQPTLVDGRVIGEDAFMRILGESFLKCVPLSEDDAEEFKAKQTTKVEDPEVAALRAENEELRERVAGLEADLALTRGQRGSMSPPPVAPPPAAPSSSSPPTTPR